MKFDRITNHPLPLSHDGYLHPYAGELKKRQEYARYLKDFAGGEKASFAHEFFGLHREKDQHKYS